MEVVRRLACIGRCQADTKERCLRCLNSGGPGGASQRLRGSAEAPELKFGFHFELAPARADAMQPFRQLKIERCDSLVPRNKNAQGVTVRISWLQRELPCAPPGPSSHVHRPAGGENEMGRSSRYCHIGRRGEHLFEGSNEARAKGTGVERCGGLDDGVFLGVLKHSLVLLDRLVCRTLLFLKTLLVEIRRLIKPVRQAEIPLYLFCLNLCRDGKISLRNELPWSRLSSKKSNRVEQIFLRQTSFRDESGIVSLGR